jgi:hypothetical protein
MGRTGRFLARTGEEGVDHVGVLGKALTVLVGGRGFSRFAAELALDFEQLGEKAGSPSTVGLGQEVFNPWAVVGVAR